MKYWSYLVTEEIAESLRDPIYSRMVAKYGNIYVNDKGGWFHQAAVKEVHEVRVQTQFPALGAVA